MGAVGIPVLGYFFSLRNVGGNYGLRTSKSTRSRGGAVVTRFDYEQIRGARQDYWYPPIPPDLERSDEDMWSNIAYFLEAVIPAAEKGRGTHEPAPGRPAHIAHRGNRPDIPQPRGPRPACRHRTQRMQRPGLLPGHHFGNAG